MKRYATYSEYSHRNPNHPGTVIAIGNFDGCHTGHQALLNHIVTTALEASLESLVFTFNPHPRIFFGVMDPRDQLFCEEAKAAAFKGLRVDHYLAQDFSESFRSLTPDEFIDKILIGSLNAKHVVIGDNFKFGKDRGGASSELHDKLKAKGVTCKVFNDFLTEESNTVSSTLIRSKLKSGDIKSANEYLGYCYSLRSKVTKGNQIGNTLGFPTANLSEIDTVIPKVGVYVCYAEIISKPSHYSFIKSPKAPGHELIPAVVNCGRRPSLTDDHQITVEAHLLTGGDYSLYGSTMSLHFLDRVRDEQTFSSKEALRSQIAADVNAAKKFFADAAGLEF